MPDEFQEYIDAVNGLGELAGDWDDKPHRLIYDLVKRARQLHARLDWIGDNATTVSDGYNEDGSLGELLHSTHARVMLLEVKLPTIPRTEKDWLGAALDRAIREVEP